MVHTPLVEAQHSSEFCALSADCIDFMFGSTGAPQFKYCIVLLKLPLQHKAGVNGGPDKKYIQQDRDISA